MDSFWEDRHVFVTGAAGFIGSWLTEELIKRGARVTAIMRDEVGYSRFISSGLSKKTAIVRGDMEDFACVERALCEYETDTIFHLGAQALVPVANRSPLSTLRSNILGTCNVLEAARLNDKTVKRIIVASSDKAYGTQPTLPYHEKMPLQGETPYDVSKSCTDLIAQAYYKSFAMPIAVSRCGNVYGGGDLNFNRLIPGTIRDVIRGRAPTIRSDGKHIRDYIFVNDVVNAYITLAEQIHRKEVSGQAFNFSTGERKDVLSVVNTILSLMNSKLQPQILNEAKIEIKEQTLDSAKAKNILNWQSSYALEKGLKETIEWYKMQLQQRLFSCPSVLFS